MTRYEALLLFGDLLHQLKSPVQCICVIIESIHAPETLIDTMALDDERLGLGKYCVIRLLSCPSTIYPVSEERKGTGAFAVPEALCQRIAPNASPFL